jgi:hypothetical protein
LARSTNYLLPWLALTAQLPYAAGDTLPNFMSFFTALGSPMLLVFSLTITIFNQRWLRRRCLRIRHNAEIDHTHDLNPLWERMKSASTLLQAAQQVPLRIRHGQGWLASLIVLSDHDRWWTNLRRRLFATRRRPTLSLVAQMAVAVAAWIMTIVGWFETAMGNADEGLAVSSSMLWTWLVSLIGGCITVGMQNGPGDVRDNLSEIPQPDFPNWNPHLARERRPFYVAEADDEPDLRFLGFSVHGDEVVPGPTYNYARIYTWRYNAARLLNAFECAAAADEVNRRDANNVAAACGLPLPNLTAPAPYLPNGHGNGHIALQPVQQPVQPPEFETYPYGTDEDGINGKFYRQVLAAVITAIVVQWGTAGSAIVIAIMTDVRGLGCRSGGYLIYGVLATAAFIALLASVVCSRLAMLHAQDQRRQGMAPGGIAFKFWCALAVALRLSGKTLVVANAAWLMASSLFELIGFFDSCWCNGVVFELKDKAWVNIFKTPADLRDRAMGPWSGGVAMATCIMVFSYGWFWLLCRKPR